MASPNSSISSLFPPCNCLISEAVKWAELCLEGVALPAIGTMGVVGNLIAILVFRYRQHTRSTFHALLTVLAIVDSLCLLTLVVDYSIVGVWGICPEVYVYILPFFWYPVKNILISLDTFLIMGIALERFFAVCRPIKYRSLELSSSFSMCPRFMVYLLPSLLFSIMLNIPKFLELKRSSFTDKNNVTHSLVGVEVTSLRTDPDYITYYVYLTRFLFAALIPFCFLLATNMKIYTEMKKKSHRMSKPRDDMAAVLIVIVFLFLISNLPKLVLSIADIYYHANEEGISSICGCNLSPTWYTILTSVSHLFLTINSSCNFIIYWHVCQMFKTSLTRLTRDIYCFNDDRG